MPAPTLAQTQQLFWKLITAPEGVARGLAALHPSERLFAQECVRGGGRLSPLERLDVYADMYFYRIRDCLSGDFGAVAAVIGEAAFHNLITDYLLEHPSTHFSLRYVGQYLPGFVRSHTCIKQWPYLADLAALEWAITEAFDAPDVEPLAAAALTPVPQERWPDIHFRLTPSLQLLDVAWPVHELWKHVQDGTDLNTQPPQVETSLRVWRQNLRVFHRRIDASERAALQVLTSGASFAAVCERIIDSRGDAEGPAHAVSLLTGWFADELIVGYTIEPDLV